MEKDRQLMELLTLDDTALCKELLTNYGPFETKSLTQRIAKYISEIDEQISSNLARNKTQITNELRMIKFTGHKYSEVEIQNGFHELDLRLGSLDKQLIGPFEELRSQVEEMRLIDEQSRQAEVMMELQKYLAQYALNENTEDYRLLGK